MTMKEIEKKKVGRPKKYDIDSEQVEKLAGFGCTNIEIASWFDCDESHIRKNYSEFLTKGREKGKIRLRQIQWRAAMGNEKTPPNVTMLIWLGKQILVQTDKAEIESDHNIEEVKFIEIK